ncbi:MAG: hypothetical protein ACPG05_04210 [Bdellovibrionales bacterium]
MKKQLSRFALTFGIAIASSKAFGISHTAEEFFQRHQAQEQAVAFMESLSFNISYEGDNEKAIALCNELASRATVHGPIAHCLVTDNASQDHKHDTVVVLDLTVKDHHFGQYTIDFAREVSPEDMESTIQEIHNFIMQTYRDLYSQTQKIFLEHLQTGQPSDIELIID